MLPWPQRMASRSTETEDRLGQAAAPYCRVHANGALIRSGGGLSGMPGGKSSLSLSRPLCRRHAVSRPAELSGEPVGPPFGGAHVATDNMATAR
jgi:hypothetical protein